MECRRVDLPLPFSPCSITSGCERSTIIGMWKLRCGNTGWARIFRNISAGIFSHDTIEDSKIT